jgi:hypothetical protein
MMDEPEDRIAIATMTRPSARIRTANTVNDCNIKDARLTRAETEGILESRGRTG